MKHTKIIATIMFILCLVFCFTGCSNDYEHGGKEWKDNIINGFNDSMQSFSYSF